MLRRHNVTLEFNEEQNTYGLNVDGYIIYLTKDDMYELYSYVCADGVRGVEKVVNYLKHQDPRLYDAKFTPIADNNNAYDVYEVLKCQFKKPVHTQKSE